MSILSIHLGRLAAYSGMLSVTAGFSLAASAQIPTAWEYFDRTNKAEVYGIGEYLHSNDIGYNGPFGPVNIKMDDTGLGGFGMAYHFNEFLSVHGDFMFGSATFSGNLPLANGTTFHESQDAFLSTGRLNLDYNIINRRLTPFLTAGIGYQYMETQLENAPSMSYWYPGWGWVYGSATAWETDFTWNVGGGVRWNITDQLFIKATVGAQWLEYHGANGITTQIEGIFAIGWMF